MKNKYSFLLSTALIIAVFFNLNLSFDLFKGQDLLLLEKRNIAFASIEGGDEGIFSRIVNCGGAYFWYEDPVDPNNSRYIWVDAFETNCLIGWPNWGCVEEACAFADYGY